MNLVNIRPFFIVRDLQTSIAYYRDRLGFTLEFHGPSDDDPYYAGLSRDDAGVMLKAILPDVLPQPNHTRHSWLRPGLLSAPQRSVGAAQMTVVIQTARLLLTVESTAAALARVGR